MRVRVHAARRRAARGSADGRDRVRSATRVDLRPAAGDYVFPNLYAPPAASPSTSSTTRPPAPSCSRAASAPSSSSAATRLLDRRRDRRLLAPPDEAAGEPERPQPIRRRRPSTSRSSPTASPTCSRSTARPVDRRTRRSAATSRRSSSSATSPSGTAPAAADAHPRNGSDLGSFLDEGFANGPARSTSRGAGAGTTATYYVYDVTDTVADAPNAHRLGALTTTGMTTTSAAQQVVRQGLRRARSRS